MVDTDIGGLLEQFGFSEKEIQTYLVILESGESKASEIAKSADVSKRYVYSISEELEERGLIEVDDHSVPTVIRPRPPEEVIDRLTRSVEELEPEISARYTARETADKRFEVIKSRQTVLKRMENLIADAESEVTLSLPIDVLPDLRPALEDATDRGVLVLLLLGDDGNGLDVASLAGMASTVRTWEARAPTMMTVDRTHGLLAPNEMLVTSTSDAWAIAITQEQLVPALVGSFLGNYWPIAEERYVTAPRDLPQTHTGFRNAVFQMALLEADDVDVEVTVEGSPVSDRDLPSTITGELHAVRQSIVRPVTSSFPVENSFSLEVNGEPLSVGGSGAFLEDFEAERVELRAAET